MRSGTALCSAPSSVVASRWVTAMRFATGAGWRALTISPSGAITVTGR